MKSYLSIAIFVVLIHTVEVCKRPPRPPCGRRGESWSSWSNWGAPYPTNQCMRGCHWRRGKLVEIRDRFCHPCRRLTINCFVSASEWQTQRKECKRTKNTTTATSIKSTKVTTTATSITPQVSTVITTTATSIAPQVTTTVTTTATSDPTTITPQGLARYSVASRHHDF